MVEVGDTAAARSASADGVDFRALFESAPGLFLVLLPDAPRYTIVSVSRDYLDAAQANREQLIGRGLFELLSGDSADADALRAVALAASLERAARTGVSDTLPTASYALCRPALSRLDVTERWWSATSSPGLAADGTVSCIVHRLREVGRLVPIDEHGRLPAADPHSALAVETGSEPRTVPRRAEEHGEGLLRALFDFMPQLGWTARPDGFIDFYNRKWHAYTGMTFEEMSGWGWQKVHDPRHLVDVMARWQRSIETGASFEMEFPLRRKDGTLRWFLTRVDPIVDEAGRILRWVGIHTDIHEHKVSGQASEARLRLLIDSIGDYAIFMLDPDGRVASWNAGAERIKGYRADEIIGKSFSVFYAAEDLWPGKCEAELAGAAATGRFEDQGWRLRKDGSRFWAQVIISAVRDNDGVLVGYSKVTHDLTEAHLAEDVKTKLMQAQEAVRLRDEFLSIASHELKTPLTVLVLELHGLVKGTAHLDAKLAQKMRRALASSERLAALVETLLDVTRISTGKLTLLTERFDLADCFAAITRRFAKVARSRLSFHAGGPIVGTWDRMRLEQLLTNLIGNADKYAPGSAVEVTVDSVGDDARVTVSDGGPGIATEALSRIFGRFERAASMDHFGGLGLGLYISKQIVEAHGGTIEVDSTLGEGATFTVRLPLHHPRIDPEKSAGSS